MIASSIDSDMRVQDIKEFGYSLATDTRRTVKGKYYVKNKILYMETLMVGGFELKNIIMECILDSTTIVNDICYSLKKGKKKFVTEHNIVLFEIPGGNTKGVLE